MAFGSTRRPKGKVDDDPTLRSLVEAGHVDGVHRRQVLGLPRHRGAADHARRGRGDGGRLGRSSSRPTGLRVFFDAEHFFDGYKAQPRVRAAGARGRGRRTAPTASCCATPTAARCPHEVAARSSARSSRYFGDDVQHRHPHPERHRAARWPTRVAAVRRRRHAGAGHDQRLRRAHRQRQPHDVSRTSTLKMGVAHAARRPPRAAHRGEPPRRRAGEPAAATRRPLRRARRRSPTRAACTPRRSAGPAAPPTSTSTPTSVGNGTRVLVSDLGGRAGMAMKAEELGVELDDRAAGGCHRGAQAARARGLLFEAADASLELLMRRAAGWAQDVLRASRRYRVTTYHREGRSMPIDEVEVDTEATVKVWVDGERHRRGRRGQRPGQRPRRRAARRARRPLPGARAHPPHRLQGAGARQRRHGTGAVVRVLIDSTDGDRRGPPIGVDANIIEASWQALVDSFVYGLLHTPRLGSSGDGRSRVRPRRRPPTSPASTSRPPWRPRGVAGRSAGRAGRRPAARAPARLPRSRPGLRHQAGPTASTTACVLTAGEHAADAMAGCTAVALKRASLFGRAPVVHDLTAAFTIWGFLGRGRTPSWCGCASRCSRRSSSVHHYMERRKIADLVPQAVLKLSHQEIAKVAAQDWRAFFKRRSAAAPAQAPAAARSSPRPDVRAHDGRGRRCRVRTARLRHRGRGRCRRRGGGAAARLPRDLRVLEAAGAGAGRGRLPGRRARTSGATRPGPGPRSSRPTRRRALIGDVLAVADAVGADRFHLVGHDWGGAVAWQVAGGTPTGCGR